MDRTLVNVISILIGGAGLLTVLTEFNVPQLNMSFFGENPFAVKRDAIDTAMKWIFTLVAVAGLALQLWAEVWAGDMPERLHSPRFYVLAAIGGLIAVGLIVWMLSGVGYWIAKKEWQPKVVAMQRELYERSKFAIEHDGWMPEHWENREALTRDGESERLKPAGINEADRFLAQIEDLLEVGRRGDLSQRAQALQPFFRN